MILSVFLNIFLDKPSKPVGPIEFSDITKDSVTLSWSPPTKDGGLPITNYIVEVKDSKRTTWSKCGDVNTDKTIFTADKLLEGNDYTFRVTAVNEEGPGTPLESIKSVRPQKPLGKEIHLFCGNQVSYFVYLNITYQPWYHPQM